MAGLSVKEAVYGIQKILLDGVAVESQLHAAATVLSKPDYDDVVTERTIANLCGYPLCKNSLPSGQNPNERNHKNKGHYRISLKEHKIYDLRESWLYCSSNCLISSRAFSEVYLSRNRTAILNPDVLRRIVDEVLAEPLSVHQTVESNEETKKTVNSLQITPQLKTFSLNLTIQEQPQCVRVDELFRAGPSNAIEGYVPKREHVKENIKRPKKKDSQNSKSILEVLASDGGSSFTSSIIIEDPQCTAPCNLEVSSEKKDPHTTDQAKKPILKSSLAARGTCDIERKVKWADDTYSSEQDGVCQIKRPDRLCNPAPEVGSSARKTKDCDSFAKILDQINNCSVGEDKDSENIWSETRSVENKRGRTAFANNVNILETSKHIFTEENNSASQSESAESIPKALAKVSQIDASEKVDANEAVSQIEIFPQDEDKRNHELREEDKAHKIWAGVSLDEEAFDARDCWYDDPPEGFSLELSPFATMWMALDGWITSSSLAYIYGREEVFANEFLNVSGREYPRQYTCGDGTSTEILKTLEGCLSRTLPSVIQALRLKVPLSSLEKGLDALIRSMTLINQIPPFRTKQWQVVALLFLDALSVHRIPSLSSQLLNNRTLIQKVLEGSDITFEQYEIMKQLLIPLGRCPVFSSHRGG